MPKRTTPGEAQAGAIRAPEAGGTGTAIDFFPADQSLPSLREAAAGCRGCGLYANATQTVFGEGRTSAEIMLVGEQPGDKEDLAGAPFVGPAGRLLDTALTEAGIDRTKVYVTNVVKHFKWRPVGKRRLHDKPNAAEVTACRPWLEAEIAQVRPRIVVCLGATAAQALLGKTFRVTRERGQFFEWSLAPFITATVHPSSILRAADERAREIEMREFIRDLTGVAARMNELGVQVAG
jgi:uracil-DNA glycosylase family protein